MNNTGPPQRTAAFLKLFFQRFWDKLLKFKNEEPIVIKRKE